MAWERLAVLLAQDGQAGHALERLMEASRRFPTSFPIRLRSADLWLFFGRPQRAEALYDEVLTIDPGSAAARRGRERSSRFAPASY
jgi:hypothetical protein